MSDKLAVTPKNFLRRLRQLARKRGLTLEQRRGRGAHLVIRLNGRRTVVPEHNRDISGGTYHQMLKDLGITADDLENP